ncbi:MAG: hypothetical protein CMN28_07625 [Salinisphaeraceae bacterium]|nr:hypothetical protein [Salinisphaeraceae bacterium]
MGIESALKHACLRQRTGKRVTAGPAGRHNPAAAPAHPDRQQNAKSYVPERFTETASGEVRARLTWRANITIALFALVAASYMWIVRLTCRFEVVGDDGLVEQATRATTVLPCGWHQGLLITGLFLAGLKRRGLRAGFLISPSREGEFIARVARLHGTAVMRGSSTRTGSQAIRALIKSLRAGVSPMIFADGPRGPAHQFKPGAVIVSNRTEHKIWLLGAAATRCWRFGTWDATIIPKPFTRITVAVSPLIQARLPEDAGPAGVDQQCTDLATQLNELTRQAEAAARR